MKDRLKSGFDRLTDLPTFSDVAYDPSPTADDSDALFGPPPTTDPEPVDAPQLDDSLGQPAPRGPGVEPPALDHVQEARRVRDVEFQRARSNGQYLPEDPRPAPESQGVDRHPRRGTYVPGRARDPEIDRGPDGRFVTEKRRRRRRR